MTAQTCAVCGNSNMPDQATWNACCLVNFQFNKQEGYPVETQVSITVEKRVVKVDSTTNYDQFTLEPTNRPVNPKKLDRLIESIKKHNLLSDKPINVTADGRILDGQTRYLAAKALGVPIYFIITDEMTMGDVPIVNDSQVSWLATDYLNYYCQQGFSDYIVLRDIWLRHREYKLSTVQNLVSYGDRKEIAKLFRSGGFKTTRPAFAEKVLVSAKDFEVYAPWWKHGVFVSAVATMFDTAGYSHERMMRKVNRQSQKLHPQVDTVSYLAMLTAIYNFQERVENHLTFVSRRIHTKQVRSYPETQDSNLFARK